MNTPTTNRTPDEIQAALAAPFPSAAVKRNYGGYAYLDGDVVVDRLNDATGGAWSLTIVSQEWRELPVTRTESKLVHLVTVELTIPGLGTRTAIGCQKIESGGSEDAMCKGALTDAIKVAATRFGCGLHATDDPGSHSDMARTRNAAVTAANDPRCADCRAEIRSGTAQVSERKFGRPLCTNCQRAAVPGGLAYAQ